jgi:hypothetical protein
MAKNPIIEISKVKYTFKYKIIKKFPFISSFFRDRSILARAYDSGNKLLFDIKIKDIKIWL